jgi:hypothetical protein
MPDTAPVYIWSVSHAIFTQPSAYGLGNFTPALDVGTDEGDLLTVYANATGLAGGNITATAGQAGVVLRNDQRTIYNGYLTDQFARDLDHSTYEDRFKLWENKIAFMSVGLVTLPRIPWWLLPFAMIIIVLVVVGIIVVVAVRQRKASAKKTTRSLEGSRLPAPSVSFHSVSLGSSEVRLPLLAHLSLLFGEARDCLLQIRDLVFHDVPHDFQVDSKIRVDEDVAQSRHLFPFDFRNLALGLIRYSFGSLADHLEVANDGVLD